jgi:dTDP-4-dehydrorhamnose 3,5-epimerase
MQLLPLSIPGAFRVLLDTKFDARGFFVRTYDKAMFEQNNLVTNWIQESHSFSSKKGTLRGLHFQNPPHGETKLVRAAQGKIFIVLLDIRPESSSFGNWDHTEISLENNELLYVPKGIAMGMCTLTDNCSLLYKMDTEYRPESGRTIRWNDPELNIQWPVESNPIISDKDRTAPLFREYLEQESLSYK